MIRIMRGDRIEKLNKEKRVGIEDEEIFKREI